MKLIKATAKDSDRLKRFYSSSLPVGPLGIKVHRKKSYFAQYDLQSNDHVTYILVDKNNEIQASASIIFREGSIYNQQQTIGYATNLHVSNSRQAILKWSEHFLPIVRKERDKRNCKYIFTTLLRSQRQAYNAFVRPRNMRRNLPRYYLFRHFNIVTLHGIFPFAQNPLTTIDVNHATESDREELAQYVVKKNKKRPIHFFANEEQFYQSLARWPQMTLNKFIIARDHEGKIIGCVAPWTNNEIQELIPKHYSPKMMTFKQSLSIYSLLGRAHKLPKVNEPLRPRNMNYLYADNPDIFYTLVYRAFEAIDKTEFLAFIDYNSYLITKTPKSFITTKFPSDLYCILTPEDPVPDFLKPTLFSEPPQFELSFL